MASQITDSQELFRLAGDDASSWVHQARLLKTAAQLPLDELEKLSQSRGDLTPYERSELLMSYMDSYMMQIGFAFENLIKGILISRSPGTVDNHKLDTNLWKKIDKKLNGHELLKLVPVNVSLNEDEKNLLLRLEAFTVWAGRYPIPKRSIDYHDDTEAGLLKFMPSDPALIQSLFFRFDKLILEEMNLRNQ